MIKQIRLVTHLAFAAFIFSIGSGASSAFAASEASRSSTDSAAESASFVNVRISALGLLIGLVNVDADFRLSNEWTLGPSLSFWNYDHTTSLFTGDKLRVETVVLGARATWSRNGTFHTGLYVSPMLKFISAKASGISKANGAAVSGTGRSPVLVGVVGYQWWFNSFMVNIGGGIGAGATSARVEVSDGVTSSTTESSNTAGLVLDGMIGYTF